MNYTRADIERALCNPDAFCGLSQTRLCQDWLHLQEQVEKLQSLLRDALNLLADEMEGDKQ